MTQGLIFLLSMLIEGLFAALLGVWISRRLNFSPFSASIRTCAAAVIGTGATHPLLWMSYPNMLE